MAEVDSDEDLTKELEPLAYYVSDRKRVLREALRTLKGKRLEAMIPPVLKSWERPRLEAACINILEDVDDETLLAILDGRAATAGVAAVEQPEEEKPVKEKVKKTKNKLKKVKSVEGATTIVQDEPKKKKKKKAVVTQEELDEAKAVKLKKKKKLLKAKKIKEKLKKKKKAAAVAAPTAVDGEPSAAAPHKSLMELLELEYRAKAIKALLRSQGQTVPDIPMDVDGEEEENSPVASTENAKPAAVPKANGPVISSSQVAAKKTVAKAKATVTEPRPEKKVPAKAKAPVKSTKPTDSIPDASKLTPKKVASPVKSSIIPNKKPEPKKGVIDLIDDALNTSFSEISDTPGSQPLKPPSVIAEALASKDSGAEEDLRSKLMKKYQQQKLEAQEVATMSSQAVDPVVKKKRKKKKAAEPKDEEEDILDLHPQELNLTDEERGGANTAEENESSEEEEEEEEESAEEPDNKNEMVAKPEETVKTPASAAEVPEEELIYDDTEEEEEINENEETVEKQMDEDSNVSNQEDSLWAAVEEGTKVEEVEETPEAENSEIVDDNESTQGSGPPQRVEEVYNEDVFETAPKGKSSGFGFSNSGQSLKRKLTFRIDPGRIKVLEEQAAEEEAKRAEERKKVEEEERLRRLEEEPEEGEIDSNEEFISDEEKNGKNKRDDTKQDRNKGPPSKSPSPPRKTSGKNDRQSHRSDHSEDDSDDSQNSTGYYARRRPYKRKASSPDHRDFGKYSPEKVAEAKKTDAESSKKRASSPVDFITQFSDMEPISDDDSNQSQQPRVKQKIGPVQGCAQRPEGMESESEEEKAADLKKSKEDSPDPSSKAEGGGDSEENEEDEDDLPKPVTWYERWAQSHGMSKVVKANKIHRKVKSKLKEVKSAKRKQPEVPKVPEPSVEAEPIIGSIEEYEKLFGKKVVVKSAEVEDDSSKSNEGMQQEEEDEEADDLWGDILGGS